MGKAKGPKGQRASLVTKVVSALHAVNPHYIVWCQGMLFFTQGDMTFEKFSDVVKERFLPIPKFRSRYDWKKSTFFPLEDEQIDMSYHLQEVADELTVEEVTNNFIGDVHGFKQVDFDKPLWYALFFPNLADGRSLAVMSIAHTMGDGVSLVELIFKTMDQEENADLKEHRGNPKRKAVNHYGPLNKGRIFMGGVLEAVTSVAASPDSPNPLFRQHQGKASTKKSLAFTPQISLAKVMEIKESIEGATVNDVLVALLNAIVVAYIEEKGVSKKEIGKKKIRASFPMNLRKSGKSALKPDGSPHNYFAMGMFQFFTKYKDGVDLIQKVKNRIDQVKCSPFPVIQLKLGALLGNVMSRKGYAEQVMDFSSQSTAQLSNVPGPQKPVHFGGAKVEDLQFALYSSMGLYLGLISYDGKVSCCVCMDDTIGDAKELAKFWEPEFETIYQDVMKRKQGSDVIKPPKTWTGFFQKF